MSTTGAPPGLQGTFDPGSVLAALAAGGRAERLLHVHEVPARTASTAAWPEWVDPAVYAAFAGSGIGELWSHQREAADLAHAGSHVVLSTGTASGKSLGYLLPVLTALVEGARAPSGRRDGALYLSPTKALAADQVARLGALAVPGLRAATYDGDTPQEERRWIREHAPVRPHQPRSGPPLLLPQHQQWAPFLRPALRRGRRVPRVPRRLRVAPVALLRGLRRSRPATAPSRHSCSPRPR